MGRHEEVNQYGDHSAEFPMIPPQVNGATRPQPTSQLTTGNVSNDSAPS